VREREPEPEPASDNGNEPIHVDTGDSSSSSSSDVRKKRKAAGGGNPAAAKLKAPSQAVFDSPIIADDQPHGLVSGVSSSTETPRQHPSAGVPLLVPFHACAEIQKKYPLDDMNSKAKLERYQRHCRVCKKKTCYYCGSCSKPEAGNFFPFCSVHTSRSCWEVHLTENHMKFTDGSHTFEETSATFSVSHILRSDISCLKMSPSSSSSSPADSRCRVAPCLDPVSERHKPPLLQSFRNSLYIQAKYEGDRAGIARCDRYQRHCKTCKNKTSYFCNICSDADNGTFHPCCSGRTGRHCWEAHLKETHVEHPLLVAGLSEM
jgi:hypothetical protein